MPHSVDSTSNSNSRSSDVPTVSTAASSTKVNPATGQPNCGAEAEQSPGITGFNFDDTPKVYQQSISPPSRDQLQDQAHSPKMASLPNGQGPQPTTVMSKEEREDNLKRQESRRRTQWYEDQFAYKPNHINQATEKIMKEAPVIAELRTNVIIKDEFTLITSLSSELSTRYRRAESSIMVTLSHSSCLMIGGTFDPAYILTVSTLPEYVQQATNQRNTFLIQRFMSDILSVPAARGIVRFAAIAEEMLGTNGNTILGHMKEKDPSLIRQLTNKSTHRKSVVGDRRKSIGAKDDMNRQTSMKSVKSLKNEGKISSPIPLTSKAENLAPASSFTRASAGGTRSRPPSTNGGLNGFGLSLNGGVPSAHQSSAPTTRPSSARKSILKMTGQSDTNIVVPPPPPVPEDAPNSKIHKRKSFVSMFKREKAA